MLRKLRQRRACATIEANSSYNTTIGETMRRTILYAWLLSALLLNACRTPQENTPPTSTPAPTHLSTPRTLVVWHPFSGAEEKALEQMRLNFEAQHPYIDVQLNAYPAAELLDAFVAAVASGVGPDILLGPATWSGTLARQGWLAPVPWDTYDALADFIPQPLTYAAAFGEDAFGVPFSVEVGTLYYNRARLSEPPETYTALREQAKVVGLAVTPSFSATSGLYFEDGGPEALAYGWLTQANAEAYLARVQQLGEQHGVTFEGDRTDFTTGRVGLLLSTSEAYTALHAALGDDLGIAAPPMLMPHPWRALARSTVAMLSINATRAAQDAAELFWRYLLTPEAQALWFEQTGHTPINVTALPAPLYNAWQRTLDDAITPPPYVETAQNVLPAMDAAVRAVTLEGKPPAEAAEALAEALATP